VRRRRGERPALLRHAVHPGPGARRSAQRTAAAAAIQATGGRQETDTGRVGQGRVRGGDGPVALVRTFQRRPSDSGFSTSKFLEGGRLFYTPFGYASARERRPPAGPVGAVHPE